MQKMAKISFFLKLTLSQLEKYFENLNMSKVTSRHQEESLIHIYSFQE